MKAMLLIQVLILVGCSVSEPPADSNTAGPTAFVDAKGTDNTICSFDKPCSKIMSALATKRPIVHIHGTISERITIKDGQLVTILGDQAILTSKVGPVLVIFGNDNRVTIKDVIFSDVHDRQVPVIQMNSPASLLYLTHVTVEHNASVGIEVVGGGNFILTRSIISTNTGGGVVVDGEVTFQIVGNIFYGNGSPSSIVGAIDIVAGGSPQNKLAFNTFYRNTVETGPAITCYAGAFTAVNNIIFNNTSPNGQNQQVGEGCAHKYSLIFPGDVLGTGNISVDPMFENPADGSDLHPIIRSPVIGAADPNSELSGLAELDLDDMPRTKPATMGAYQF